MAAFKALLNFTQLSDSALRTFAEGVKTGMTGNAAYPNPEPKLEDLQTAITVFSESLPDPANLNQNNASVKNDNRAALLDMLRQLAAYVTAASKGDRTLILSSGFKVSKERQAAGQLPTPEKATATYGTQSGSVNVACKRVKNAFSYEAQARNGTEEWGHTKTCPPAKVLLEGLIPGNRYEFQIRAIGTAGPSGWAQIAGMIVV